jgi:hypothetical protein
VWFCEGVVLKAALNPTEVGGLGYHVTWVKKDETSPFGFGIPRLMRNSQKVANASWRMVMDNAGLALAPQIIMAMGVRPADGNWTLYPGKVWIMDGSSRRARGDDDLRPADPAEGAADDLRDRDEARGRRDLDAGHHAGRPLARRAGDRRGHGDALQRRQRDPAPLRAPLRRPHHAPDHLALYDWNMAYNPKEEIKGDYTVEALGSSALLEKERYAQNVLAALNLCASARSSSRASTSTGSSRRPSAPCVSATGEGPQGSGRRSAAPPAGCRSRQPSRSWR